jgi:isopropylmalate/homocitrate/citramalate synthase
MADVQIVDVAPRDGLQNAPRTLEPRVRAQFGSRLAAAGVQRQELVSFVSAKRVPQMAGAEEVVAAVAPPLRDRCCGLVLNERGFERLLASGLRDARYTFGASDPFNRRNAGQSTQEGLQTALRIIRRGHDEGVRVGVVIATSFGCPFAGEVDSAAVVAMAEQVARAGPDELVFADTIGVAVPRQVREVFVAANGWKVPLGLHAHNTRNTGYACAITALEAGATILDASTGGLGGCPFAPGATGNIATEDLVYLLEREGVATGLDLDALTEISAWLREMGFETPAQLTAARRFPPRPGARGPHGASG